MASTFVSDIQYSDNSSGTVLTAGAPIAVQAGDGISIFIKWEDTGTGVTASVSDGGAVYNNDPVINHAAGDFNAQHFYKIAEVTGNITPVLTLSASRPFRAMRITVVRASAGKILQHDDTAQGSGDVTSIDEVTLANLTPPSAGICVSQWYTTFGCDSDFTDTVDAWQDTGLGLADEPKDGYIVNSGADTITPALRFTSGSGAWIGAAIAFIEVDAGNIQETINDSAAIVDSVTAPLTIPRTINDSVAIVDSVTAPLTIPTTLNESLSITDAASAVVNPGGSITPVSVDETAAIVDSVTAPLTIPRTINDSAAIVDSLIASIIYDLPDEVVSIVDAATARIELGGSVPESLNISDEATIVVHAAESDLYEEAVAIVDEAIARIEYALSINESIQLADASSAAVNSNQVQEATDSLVITDQATVKITYSIVLNETVSLLESITQFRFGSGGLSDWFKRLKRRGFRRGRG